MSAIENQEVFNYLKTIGCCNTCCLRYFNGRGDDYLNIDKSLLSVNWKYYCLPSSLNLQYTKLFHVISSVL